MDTKMKLNRLTIADMTCCSWHTPRNAIVTLRTGKIVPQHVLDSIPDSPAKQHMMYSGNMCDPCAKKLLESSGIRLQEEPIMQTG